MSFGGEVKHSVERTFSVLSVLAVLTIIGLVIWACYVTIVKPHGKNRIPTTTQKAEKIENKNTEIHHHGIFHFKLGPISIGF